MSATGLLLLGIVGAGVLVAVAVFLVAYRRGPSGGAFTVGELDATAIKADQAARKRKEAELADAAEGGAVATLEKTDVQLTEEYEGPPPVDPLLVKEDVTATEYGITRRKFFNRALLAVFGLFLLQFTIASLAFLWPKLRGGFGTPINAGKFTDIKEQILSGGAGNQQPLFVSAAQSWVTTFPISLLEESSFNETPFVVAGGEDDGVGLMALWQRCVHLGCRVPTCTPSQGFECPCHGSKYNLHGEYEAGPAPRNLDRFGVEIDDNGDFIIMTGTIVQTARAKIKTSPYPQGPFCI